MRRSNPGLRYAFAGALAVQSLLLALTIRALSTPQRATSTSGGVAVRRAVSSALPTVSPPRMESVLEKREEQRPKQHHEKKPKRHHKRHSHEDEEQREEDD